MKTRSDGLVAILIAIPLLPGCSPHSTGEKLALGSQPEPWTLILDPQARSAALDEEIRDAQAALRRKRSARVQLERLGWLFVVKARHSYDAGYYTLADQVATH